VEKTKAKEQGVVEDFVFTPRKQKEYFAFHYSGYIYIPEDGVYNFYTVSDDGSKLFIGDSMVVDNDGLHGMREREGVIALKKGLHPISVSYFEKTGGDDLIVQWKGPGLAKQKIPVDKLFH
jgi:hypothetical protein